MSRPSFMCWARKPESQGGCYRFRMFLMLLSACALITQAEYDERMGTTESPGDSADSGTGGDELELIGELEVGADRDPVLLPEEGLVGVVPFRVLPSEEGDTIEVGDPIAVGPVEDLVLGHSRGFKLSLPAVPAEEHFYELPNAFEDGSTFLLGAWEDRNGDELPDDKDMILGANVERVLVYVRGEEPGELWPEGEGWYLVTLAPEGGVTDVDLQEDYVAYDLQANLMPNGNSRTPVIGKLEDGVGDHEAPRVCFFDWEVLRDFEAGEDFSRPPVLLDKELSSTGTFEFADGLGVPPPENLVSETRDGDYGPFGIELASFLAIAYNDDNLNGEFDLKLVGGDRILGSSAQAGQDSSFVTYYRATGFQAAFLLVDVDAGWNRFHFALTGGATPTDWDQPFVLDDTIGD